MTELFAKELMYGIEIGCIYALLALGYSLVFSVMGMVNFAHGDIFMLGIYALFFTVPWCRAHRIGVWCAILFSALVCAVCALLIERFAYRPIPKNQTVITSIAVGLLLQNTVQALFGADPHLMPTLLAPDSLSMQTVSVTVFLTLLILFWLYRTPSGRAIRAVADDEDAAACCGIEPKRAVRCVFWCGACLASIASLLYSARYPAVFPTIGAPLGLKAYTASVIGGIASPLGAVLGGLCLGILEVMLKAYLQTWTHGAVTAAFADGAVYTVLLVMLLIRPTGMLGSGREEKL